MPPQIDIPFLRVRPNLYAKPAYFNTDVSLGATRTPRGVRVCALTNDFLIGFRDAVIFESGKAYRRVLKTCGRRWGGQFMRRFEADVTAHYQTPLAELSAGVIHACLADAFNYHGWGLLAIDLKHLDEGVVIAEIRNPLMPEVIGESDRPVDFLMAGLLAAVFSHLSGQEVDCVQTDCPTQGADASRFLASSVERIKELDAWSAKVSGGPTHSSALKRLLYGETEGER